MNTNAKQPLTRRLAARPIGVRLAHAGLPPTLAEAGVESGFHVALRLPVMPVARRVAA